MAFDERLHLEPSRRRARLMTECLTRLEGLHDLVFANANERANAVAVVDGPFETTYFELAQRVETAAAELEEIGVRAGDRVGIRVAKSLEEIVATFAVSKLGAVFVNVASQLTLAQLGHIVRDCGIRTLIADGRRLDEVRSSSLGASIERLVSASELGKGGARAPVTLGGRAQDLAGLIYTSGSTGRPKGVMFSHETLLDYAEIVSGYLEKTESDRVLSLLPLSFGYGLNQVLTTFLVGGTLVLQKVAMPLEVEKTVLQKRITGIAGTPTIWTGLVRHLIESGRKLEGLRYITSSGDKLPREVLEAMPEVFPGARIFLMFGQTEGLRSTFLPPEHFRSKLGSIGKAVPGVQVFVVDRERGLCGPGEVGELIHRGKLLSKGYYGDPEATAERIKPCPHLAHLIGDEPVLHTGDLVRQDAEGFLWFVGRSDSLIKSSGFRVSPTEVEHVVLESGLVNEAVAFGKEDRDLGQIVAVVVSSKAGEALDREALRSYCREKLPGYMVPRAIHAWEGELPKRPNGKVDRVLIREALGART